VRAVVSGTRSGQRIRLRIINAAADTTFRVAVGGHQLRITHSDGYPVQPVTAGCLLIGMGERYDAIVELTGGVFPLVAVAEGKAGQGFVLIRIPGFVSAARLPVETEYPARRAAWVRETAAPAAWRAVREFSLIGCARYLFPSTSPGCPW
jgi:FtsP/CotA-like multicopper oxidase with cupredoxin domain